MRNKKSTLGFILLALVLVLGVGYATVSSVVLNITGSASVQASDLNVSFTGTTTTSSSSKVTASASADSKNATISVTGLTLNEPVTATYTVINKETDVNAKIGTPTITNPKSTYFKVTTDVDTTPKIINAGGTNTTTVTVTVELIKTPIAADDSTVNISVALNATATTESST